MQSAESRRRTADRIFTGALVFNTALTIFWIYAVATQRSIPFFGSYNITRESLQAIAGGILFFYVAWGFVWYGVKRLLLRKVVGFSDAEIRQAFSSRMREPYDVTALLARYSERRIRIVDMIGRRGRFITLAASGFFYLYNSVQTQPASTFATAFVKDNLFDAVVTSWVFLAFYYGNGILAAAFYGPQSRVMDGMLARANCLLITTLWTAFKFVLVPIGARLSTVFAPSEFAVVFAMIWGSYIAADAMAEVGGSIFGTQRIRVWGVGDINRKSVGGTVSAFAGSLALCAWVVSSQGLPLPWMGLALVISASNALLELFSPRGTDDFVMATMNALICLGFGVLIR